MQKMETDTAYLSQAPCFNPSFLVGLVFDDVKAILNAVTVLQCTALSDRLFQSLIVLGK
jgi:hypothetical protein